MVTTPIKNPLSYLFIMLIKTKVNKKSSLYIMSNKAKVLYESKDGQELAQWLQSMSQHPDYKDKTNRRMLDNKRILYCVRANMDNSLIKFGIGGVEHGGTSAMGGCCNT